MSLIPNKMSCLGAPNELFCKKAALQWVICWENGFTFMSCWQDEIQLLGDHMKISLLNGHYRREATTIVLEP